MSWLIIILSGCMEIGVVYNVKKSEGFTKLKYTLLCFMFIFFSVSLLYAALRAYPSASDMRYGRELAPREVS